VGHVELRGVRLDVGGAALLDGLTLCAEPGELVAVVGPNGAGKSTLLRALAGFVRPGSGTISHDGRDLASLDARGRAQAVTLIANDGDAPPGMTIRELVATGRFAFAPWWDWSPRDDGHAVDAALRRVGLATLAGRDVAALSSGERQRAWLALALAQDARTVLLDEPTSHLDPRHALDVSRMVRSLAAGERTVFVVSHDLNEAASIADRIAVLGEHRLLAYAAPQEALDPTILERAYGVVFDRVTIAGAPRVLARGYR